MTGVEITGDAAPQLPLDVLRERAQAEPSARAAVVDSVGELTIGSWDERSDALAAALVERGIPARARIALLFDGLSVLEFAIAYMGVLKAACTAVPMSRDWTAAETSHICERAQVTAIVHDSTLGRPDVEHSTIAYPEIAGTRGHRHRSAEVSADTLAEILSTSGSTGASKLVGVSHGNIAGEAPIHWSKTSHAIQMHALPLGTNYAQAVLRSSVTSRVTLIVMPRFDLPRFFELIALHRPDGLMLVPALASLLASSDPRDVDLSSVHSITVSAAALPAQMPAKLKALFPRATIYSGYTSTEAWPARTIMEFGVHPPDSVGEPEEGHSVRVVDAAGRPAPPGEIGEIHLRSKTAPARFYLEADVNNKPTFARGWVGMSDLGYLDPDGVLTLVDREADVIGIGGFKVFTIEVEDVLLEHPSVMEAAVFGVDDPILGQQVAAAVVLTDKASSASLRAFAADHVAEYKVPSSIVAIEQLPRTFSGKVSKRRLKELHRAGKLSPEGSGDGTVEQQIREMWMDALGAEDVDLDEDLLARGASSLLAFGVISRVSSRFSVAVPPSRFLATATIVDQANLIRVLCDEQAAS